MRIIIHWHNTFKILSKIAIFMIKAVLNRKGLVTQLKNTIADKTTI